MRLEQRLMEETNGRALVRLKIEPVTPEDRAFQNPVVLHS